MKKTNRSNLLLAAGCLAVIAGSWAVATAYLRARGSTPGAVPAPELAQTTIKSDVVPGDHCPTLTSWVVSPLKTSVGAWIDVNAAATDIDPGESVTYAWAPSEAFETPGHASSRYRCSSPGPQALLLKVSDDHHPTPCSTWFRIIVDCLPAT